MHAYKIEICKKVLVLICIFITRVFIISQLSTWSNLLYPNPSIYLWVHCQPWPILRRGHLRGFERNWTLCIIFMQSLNILLWNIRSSSLILSHKSLARHPLVWHPHTSHKMWTWNEKSEAVMMIHMYMFDFMWFQAHILTFLVMLVACWAALSVHWDPTLLWLCPQQPTQVLSGEAISLSGSSDVFPV